MLLAFSVATFYAMGMRGAVLASVITTFVSFLLVNRMPKKFFILYTSVIFLVSLFLLPNTMIYGRLSLGMVMSMMQTDVRETYEYLTNIPVKSLLLSLAYIVLFILLLYTYRLYKPDAKAKTNTLIFNLLLFFIGIFYNPITNYAENKTKDYVESMAFSYYPPVKFAFSTYHHLRTYKQEKERLVNAQHIPSTWEVLSAQPTYKNYIVIIGESARRDYHSLYGYPVNTNPFMSSVNATIFNHYISPASYTVTSIKRMLIQNDKKSFNYPNTVVTLANSAGFETYWLSNQGYLGRFDTDASLIALNAKHTFFANKLDYSSSASSDLTLLPELKKVIAQKTDKPKVIFMHLIGSHSRFCRRLDENYKITPITGVINKEMSCYLTSLLQTDKLIETTYRMLQQNQESFSIMYFSDHGQGHRDKGHFYVGLRHSENTKQGYDVPMIVMSSDDNGRKFIHAKKSGFNFIRQFSEWTRIKTKGTDLKQHFFTEEQPKKIQVFAEQLIDYDDLPDDPAMRPQ